MERINTAPRSLVLRLAIGVAGMLSLFATVHLVGEGAWIEAAVTAAAGMYGIWWAFPRNEAEAKQVRFPSDEGMEYFERLAAADGARERCDCCGSPTLDELSPSDCLLCEWDPNEGVILEEARENFTRYGTVYPPDRRPEWNPFPPSAEERAAAEALVTLYRQNEAAGPAEKYEVWLRVVDAETALQRVREQRTVEP